MKENILSLIDKPNLEIKSGLRAGYRPVHGLVAPDGWSKWVPGWFDMDSMGRKDTSNAPPPPPPE